MMEENNRKGPGVFYAVMGVATLVVAIIGATFAFFSATATVDGDAIGGSTENLAGALSVTVNKVDLGGVGTGVGQAATDNLVPTDITGATAENINTALTAKCVADGYTGCHVYKITAKSTANVSAATLTLDTLTVSGDALKDKTSWKYVIYKGSSDTVATNIVVDTASFEVTEGNEVTIHNAAMNAGTDYVYYLMVFVADKDESQNADNNSNVVGTYTGTVSMNAAGGEVRATFSA